MDKKSDAGRSVNSRLTSSQLVQNMSYRADSQRKNITPQRPARQSLKEYLNENEVYEDLVEQINKKIALKQAIERANEAIASSKQPSTLSRKDLRELDLKSQASKHDYDERSRVSNSKLSLIALSNKGK